jgi:hypothetical protein
LILIFGSVLLLVFTSLRSSIASTPPIQLPTVDFSEPIPATITPVELENTVITESAHQAFGDDDEEGPSTLQRLAAYAVFLLSLALVAVEVARGVRTPVVTEGWGGVGFSAFLALLSGLDLGEFGERFLLLGSGEVAAHRTSLLTVYFFSTLVTFRSTLIHSNGQGDLLMDSVATSLVLTILLIDVLTPYRASLDGVLAGKKSRGRQFHRYTTPPTAATTTESGEKIRVQRPPPIEEPLSLASRALFSFLQPLIWRHYWTPIEEKDVPQLREDDQTAVVVGGWRGWNEFRESERRGLKEGREKLPEGKGSLSWKLLVYFKGYFVLQAVSEDAFSSGVQRGERLTCVVASLISFAVLVGCLRPLRL